MEAVYPPTRTCGLGGEGRPLCPGKHHDPHKTTEKPVSDCALGARWCDGRSEARRGVGRTGAPARGQGPCFGDPRLVAYDLCFCEVRRAGPSGRKKRITCHCLSLLLLPAATCSTHSAQGLPVKGPGREEQIAVVRVHTQLQHLPPGLFVAGPLGCKRGPSDCLTPGKGGGFQVRFLRLPRIRQKRKKSSSVQGLVCSLVAGYWKCWLIFCLITASAL